MENENEFINTVESRHLPRFNIHTEDLPKIISLCSPIYETVDIGCHTYPIYLNEENEKVIHYEAN
jgi:hypothetical protein